MTRVPLSIAVAFLLVSCGGPNIVVQTVEPEGEAFFTQVIDFEGNVGHGLSLATDADGNPHLAYLLLPEEEAGATPTPVPGPTGSPGATPSPEATVLGEPIIPAVMHAHIVGDLLTRSIVADDLPDLSETDETAIAVDGDGIHHVVWTEDGSLFYSTNAAGDFSEPTEIPAEDATGPSIAAGADGTVVASFSESTGVEGPGGLVRVATIVPTDEVIDGVEVIGVEVTTAAEAGAAGPTGVGLSGQTIVVAYGDEGETKLARQQGDRFVSETADPDGGFAVSMALDADGNPHLAYASAGGEVKHAHSIDGGAWEVSPVGETRFSPEESEVETTIALDAEGIHHIAWTDGTGISYASNAEGEFGTPEQVPGTDTAPAAESPSIAIGAAGVSLAWFDPEDTEVQLSVRTEEELLLALPSPTVVQTGGPPAAECEPEGTELSIAAPPGAVGAGFDKDCLAVNAGEAFSIAFANDDTGQPHNVAIYPDSDAALSQSDAFLQGEVITAPDSATYQGDPIDEPGEYPFQCDVHPTTMVGTFVIAGEEGDGGGGGGGGGGG